MTRYVSRLIWDIPTVWRKIWNIFMACTRISTTNVFFFFTVLINYVLAALINPPQRATGVAECGLTARQSSLYHIHIENPRLRSVHDMSMVDGMTDIHSVDSDQVETKKNYISLLLGWPKHIHKKKKLK